MSGNNNDGARGEHEQPGNQCVLLETIIGQLQTMMRELENMWEEMEEIRTEREQRGQEGHRNQASLHQHRPQPREMRNDVKDDFKEKNYDQGLSTDGDMSKDARENLREDDNFRSIQSKIPEFKGRNDPVAYLE